MKNLLIFATWLSTILAFETLATPKFIEMDLEECRTLDAASSSNKLGIGEPNINVGKERCVLVPGTKDQFVFKCAPPQHPHFNDPSKSSLQLPIFEENDKRLRFGTIRPGILEYFLDKTSGQVVTIMGPSNEGISHPDVTVCRGKFTSQ